MFLFLLPVLITLLRVLQLEVHGYTPARPSNATVQPGSGQASTYRLHLQWYTNNSDWHYVTRQQVGLNSSSDLLEGVLVRFTESNAGRETTTTPWIAFISCDANSTYSSQEADIFAMAKDRGAKSAILYSLYSGTCVINPGYRDSVLDVFTTQTSDATRRIEYDFDQLGPSNYKNFDATMLNNAEVVIKDTIALGYPVAPGFLFTTLSAFNASDVTVSDGVLQANANNTSPPTSSNGSQDTGVAMIILYAITGCVSALFCGVIVSGAIKAIRHPERYGPRRADPTLGGGQSRAGGLGRAILDTFPIVKFGSSGNDRLSRPKDIESAPVDPESSISVPPPNSVQLAQLGCDAEHGECSHDPREEPVATTAGQEVRDDNRASERMDQADLAPQINTVDHGTSTSAREIVPESMGRETCPICILDFEEGDDLRVLPCEGKHRFHQSCVDPWLLELSGSCPLCRQDFRALETIISGGPENESPSANRYSYSSTSAQNNRRFSRYLRFALGRQRRASGDQGSPLPES